MLATNPWLAWLRGVVADARGRPDEARAWTSTAEALDPSLAEQIYAPR